MKSILLFALFLTLSLCLQSQISSQKEYCKKQKEVELYDSTHIKSEAWYCGSIQDSIYRKWYRSGEIMEEGFYKNGVKNGSWKKIDFGSTDHKFGYKTIREYSDGLLNEERIYEFRDSTIKLFIINLFVYNTTAHDTVEVRRQFYPSTGVMTLMDTLINGFSNGTERQWNEKNGKLVSETFSSLGHNVFKTTYDGNNNKTVQTYFEDGWHIKEEFIYNGLGKLTEELHYDEKGNLISEKKY